MVRHVMILLCECRYCGLGRLAKSKNWFLGLLTGRRGRFLCLRCGLRGFIFIAVTRTTRSTLVSLVIFSHDSKICKIC